MSNRYQGVALKQQQPEDMNTFRGAQSHIVELSAREDLNISHLTGGAMSVNEGNLSGYMVKE
jgi:hypothetical protein